MKSSWIESVVVKICITAWVGQDEWNSYITINASLKQYHTLNETSPPRVFPNLKQVHHTQIIIKA